MQSNPKQGSPISPGVASDPPRKKGAGAQQKGKGKDNAGKSPGKGPGGGKQPNGAKKDAGGNTVKGGAKDGKQPRQKLPKDTCRKCGETGHWGNECPNQQNLQQQQQQAMVGQVVPGQIVQGQMVQNVPQA